jgi:hypothetical protein
MCLAHRKTFFVGPAATLCVVHSRNACQDVLVSVYNRYIGAIFAANLITRALFTNSLGPCWPILASAFLLLGMQGHRGAFKQVALEG